MDAISSKTEEILNKMCDNIGVSEEVRKKTIEEIVLRALIYS